MSQTPAGRPGCWTSSLTWNAWSDGGWAGPLQKLLDLGKRNALVLLAAEPSRVSCCRSESLQTGCAPTVWASMRRVRKGLYFQICIENKDSSMLQSIKRLIQKESDGRNIPVLGSLFTDNADFWDGSSHRIGMPPDYTCTVSHELKKKKVYIYIYIYTHLYTRLRLYMCKWPLEGYIGIN